MLIFALAAALLYGSADFLGGVAARRASPFAVIAVTMPAGALIVLAVAVVTTATHHGAPGTAMTAFGGWGAYAWATAGAVSGAGGLVAFYTGFARAPMSVVAPVSALVSTVLPVGVAIAGGERPGVSVIIGAVVCLTAIVLVSAHSDEASPGAVGGRLRGLVYGSVAGASFGLFFLCMKYAGHSAVLWPVAVQRVTGSVLALVALGVVGAIPLWRRDRRPRRIGQGGVNSRLLAVALASGAIDATANVCYILATRAGAFGLAVVITSLYPGATVLLARFVLRERMRAVQQVGLMLAAAGIVLVTA